MGKFSPRGRADIIYAGMGWPDQGSGGRAATTSPAQRRRLGFAQAYVPARCTTLRALISRGARNSTNGKRATWSRLKNPDPIKPCRRADQIPNEGRLVGRGETRRVGG